MATLTKAHRQLFSRAPDERFATFSDLWEHCHNQQKLSRNTWHRPQDLEPVSRDGVLDLYVGNGRPLTLNDWSFTQLCSLAGVSKETVNRVSADTAKRVLEETLPRGEKPFQVYSLDGRARSVHRLSYTRLYNVDLLSTVMEFATDFQAPQETADGATGLYCGEQDLFCFLIDPLGWTEIEGEAFAPGFFLWNSEVGRRSVGVQTFWFQAVCQNHIVWDAVEVVEFSRKHTTNVGEALDEVRRIVERLTKRRDKRKDAFARVMAKAAAEKLGDSVEEILPLLQKYGIARRLASDALKVAQEQGRFTVFAVVDALTRLSADLPYAGDRTDADAKAARLLELAA